MVEAAGGTGTTTAFCIGEGVIMEFPDNGEVYDTPPLRCFRGRDNIVYAVSKNTVERSIAHYSIVFDVYSKLSSGGKNKFCLLADISETQPLETDVRKYIEGQMSRHVKAMALVSNTTLGAATGSIFQVLSGSPFPMGMFSDRQVALQWLRQHL